MLGHGGHELRPRELLVVGLPPGQHLLQRALLPPAGRLPDDEQDQEGRRHGGEAGGREGIMAVKPELAAFRL